MLHIRKFFIYSFTAHIFIIVALFLSLPTAKEEIKKPKIFARLVSPDDIFNKKPVIVPLPRSRPVPDIIKKDTPSQQEIKEMGDFSEPTETATPTPSPSRSPSSSQKTEDKPVGNKGSQKNEATGLPLREKLFDNAIIGDLAKREVTKEERTKKTFTFDTEEYRFLLYNQRLKERLESIWIYPRDAAARGIYGDLYIRFTIKKNGRLGAVELMRTSGHKNLDDAAMRALRDGDPYWPLPDEWGIDGYTIVGHFIYSIYGFYVR
jgi:protein TonB